MELRIEDGVLCGDIPDGCWNGNWEDEDRLVELIVPECVTAIKDRAFFGDPWIRKVVIPGTVKVIGKEAFAACSHLEVLVIEEGVVQIKEEAFRDCRITKLSLPRHSLKYIGYEAFDSNYFRKLELPQELEYLGEASFRCNPNLESVTIPGTVNRIGAAALKAAVWIRLSYRKVWRKSVKKPLRYAIALRKSSFPQPCAKSAKMLFMGLSIIPTTARFIRNFCCPAGMS